MKPFNSLKKSNEEEFRPGFNLARRDPGPCLLENIEVDFVGMQISSAVIFVLFGVESQEKASCVESRLRFILPI